jgi:hypothetical protein
LGMMQTLGVITQDQYGAYRPTPDVSLLESTVAHFLRASLDPDDPDSSLLRIHIALNLLISMSGSYSIQDVLSSDGSTTIDTLRARLSIDRKLTKEGFRSAMRWLEFTGLGVHVPSPLTTAIMIPQYSDVLLAKLNENTRFSTGQGISLFEILREIRDQLPIIDGSPLFEEVRGKLVNRLITYPEMKHSVHQVGSLGEKDTRELSLGLSLSLLDLHHRKKIELTREQDFLNGIPVWVPYSIKLPDIGVGEPRHIHKIKKSEEI